jgi:serine/threonine protein kinase
MAASPSSRIRVPERYSVVRHIANGGMASVWEATDELLGRSVAVKVLSPAFAADDAARRRFTREARAAARLSTHPHVVTVYDAGEHEGQAYMVMALYPGGTVAERIKAGPVPRPQALDWLEDAAGALDLAHGEGVVHRDVKPANLLLDAGDRVAVADFGIATAAWETSMTSTGMVLGTLAYLAPEQRTGGLATPASDRYALALVARELLTGARPGTEATNPVALPAAAEVALNHATAEDPAARPASCAALVAELEAALGEPDRTEATHVAPARPRAVGTPVVPVPEPTAARTAPRVPRAPAAVAVPPTPPPDGPARPTGGAPSRGGRGSKLLVALAVLALLVGVGAAIAAALGGGDDPPAKQAGSGSTEKARTSTAKKKTTSTATPAASTPAPAPEPEPEPTASAPATSTQAPATPTKSRSTLIAQNNQAYAATSRDPAAQVAPLQEAVDGLCTDESDVNCAFALFNLARALRLSGRPAEAVPLLERRLAISDNQVGAVQAELATARQAAGQSGGGSTSSGKGNGKAKKAGK